MSNHIKKIRFEDDEDESMYEGERRKSLGNEKTLQLNKRVEQKSLTSTQTIRELPNPSYLNQRIRNLSVGSSQVGEIGIDKTIHEKHSSSLKTPRHTPKVRVETLKVIHIVNPCGSKHF